MKFRKLIITLLMCLSIFSLTIIIEAATFIVSSSTGSVSSGGTFTVTISVPGSGMFYISGNNASPSVSSLYCDTACSFSVSAGSSGTASVTATAGAPGTANEVTAFEDDSNITGSKSVSVAIISANGGSASNGGSSSNGSNSESNTPVDATDSPDKNDEEENNKLMQLSELSISDGTLTPSFSPNIKEYTVNLIQEINKITVDANSSEEGAEISGNGEHSLKVGNNVIEVSVANASGERKSTYKITVIVESPKVYLTGFDEKLGVLSLNNAPILDGFEDYVLTINKEEVTARKNTNNGLILLYMINEDGDANYYIYDEEKKKITSIYIPVSLLGNNYAIVTVPEKMKSMTGLTYKKVTISEQEFDGWAFKNKSFKNYSLVYLMDENADTYLYQYESTKNTFQIYSNAAAITQESYEKLVNEFDSYKTISYALISVAVILAFTTLGLSVVVLKKRKK